MDSQALAKKLEQMDVDFIQQCNKHKWQGMELQQRKNDHAASKFNFLVEHKIIIRNHWEPET